MDHPNARFRSVSRCQPKEQLRFQGIEESDVSSYRNQNDLQPL